MSSGNPNFDTLLSTTLANYRDTLADNLSAAFFLFYWLTTQGRKIYEDGGESIVVQLLYGQNTTVRSYDGYEELDVTPQEGITAAKYPWKQLSGSVSISRKEERQNSGKARIINLLQSKVTQTEITMKQELNRMFMADGTGNDSKDIFGLDLLVEDGTAWGTVGGIDSNANPFWRNQWIGSVGAFGTGTSANGIKKMRTLYNNTSRGNEHPDIGITTQSIYESYEDCQVNNQRFLDDRIANMGFELLKFKGMILGFDANCISGAMFMLTSAYLQFVVDTQTDLINTPFVRPENQDARTSQILLMGNLVTSNRQRQGRLDGIS